MRVVWGSALRASVIAAVLLTAACAASHIVFVSDGASYTFKEVERLPSMLDTPRYLGAPVSEASVLRRDALVDLRGMGTEAAELAELVTQSLPASDRAVPYYAEAAEVEGVPAWIVLEVWGSAGGTLEHTRTWVLDRSTGEVLFSSSGQ